MVMKTRPIKIIAFILLGISQIPWLYSLVISIYNIFDGIWFMTGRAYGLVAFILTWTEHLSKAFPVYICAVILTAASIVAAITAINKDKKQKGKDNVTEA